MLQVACVPQTLRDDAYCLETSCLISNVLHIMRVIQTTKSSVEKKGLWRTRSNQADSELISIRGLRYGKQSNDCTVVSIYFEDPGVCEQRADSAK
jgi:hypothetical protein